MNKIDKTFTRLSIIIPVTITNVHLLVSLVYESLNIGSLLTMGYLSVALLTLLIDIPLSIIAVIVLNFIKETIIYRKTREFSLPYLLIIVSAIASFFTIICYYFLQIFVETMINDILFMCMISFLLLSLILFIVYFIKKKLLKIN